jgi:hypothetical protein
MTSCSRDRVVLRVACLFALLLPMTLLAIASAEPDRSRGFLDCAANALGRARTFRGLGPTPLLRRCSVRRIARRRPSSAMRRSPSETRKPKPSPQRRQVAPVILARITISGSSKEGSTQRRLLSPQVRQLRYRL